MKLEEEIKKKMDIEAFDTLADKIKLSLSNFQKDIQTYKLKKYKRDTKDYGQGTVYDWHGEEKRFLKPRHLLSKPDFRSRSGLSTASKIDSSDGIEMEGCQHPFLVNTQLQPRK